MNDIFLSYASGDRAIAHRFSNVLEALGWSVWWDREIPHGKDFDLVIEQELSAARCAIVLWSRESVQSRWVRSEASAAADRECLIPVLIEEVELPLEFRQLQTAVLVGWNGDTKDPEFVRLLESITRFVGRGPKMPSSLPEPAAPASRRRLAMGALALAVLAVAVLAFVFRGGRTDIDQTSETSPRVAEQPTRVDEAGALAIAIGDAIEDGAPGPGAGVIATAHEKDVYTFSASPGQRVYFRVLSYDPSLAAIEWRLLDANDAEIFRTCLGCGHPGVQPLRSAGRYTLIVGSDRDAGVGAYRLRLHDVPAPDRFEIAIGAAVSEKTTGRGAGIIESPGAEDVYVFEATPRQRVYFRTIEHSSGIAQARLRLLDSDEMQVFETCLGCGEPGVHALTKGGAYTLIVGIRNDPATGTYRLQLFDVPPPDEFTIGIPARIANGVPGRGAGLIESPGAEDRYALVVDAGQKLALKLIEHDRTLTYNLLRLIAEDGTELFSRCFGCGAPELQTLSRGGRYYVVVGNPREASTGAYALDIASR